MTTAWPIAPRIDLQDLVPFLSPGTIVGVYDAAGWLDWQVERPAPVEILSVYDLLSRPSGDPGRFHCVILGGSHGISVAELGGALAVLVGTSRGLALVTSRVGILLQLSHRILGPIRERTSGPHPRRTSGGWISPVPGNWRLLEPADVARQAMLSLRVGDSRAAVRALDGRSSVRVSGDLVHLGLEGGTPEEILERLWCNDIRVTGSAVWYPALQSSPLETDMAGH
ncbi:MAG: hypothetical protein ABI836_09340 [Gemmatimonadota bacterium]